MIDPNFYLVTTVSAKDIAEAVSLSCCDDQIGVEVSSVASASNAGPKDLTFVENPKQVDADLEAAVCFAPVGAGDQYDGPAVILETHYPRAAYNKASELIVRHKWGWDQSESIHPTATIEDGVTIGPNVTIGPDVKVGAGTVIEPGAVIGGGVAIGQNCRIGANTTVSHCYIGDRVVIFPGVAIGQAGFGLSTSDKGLIDTPHFGRVIIQDDVSLGACTTVDRGMFDDTLISQGVKVDNLCQIAHNAVIGPHSVMAAFAGVAGSSTLGTGVMLGGRAGVSDHLKVEDGASLAAGSATMKDIPAGETWMGLPAKPIKTFFREVAWLSRSSVRKPKS